MAALVLQIGITYLDHAATTLYPESLVRDYFQDISRNVYGERSHIKFSNVTFMSLFILYSVIKLKAFKYCYMSQ